VGKLLSVILAAGAAALSAPAMAEDRQEDRREVVRKACPEGERCQEPRRVFPWFYRGHDEDVQSRRRVIRRISYAD